MKSRITPMLALLGGLAAVACSHHVDLTKASGQANFGVQMAKMDLWREAMFRFQRAVEIDPKDALVRNNLAVAYEANGDFEKARKEYLEALRLDRSNQYIQKNYSRFVEFLSRNRKRQPPHGVAEPIAPTATGPTVIQATPPAPGEPPVGRTGGLKPASPASPQPPSDLPPPAPQPPPAQPPPKGVR